MACVLQPTMTITLPYTCIVVLRHPTPRSLARCSLTRRACVCLRCARLLPPDAINPLRHYAIPPLRRRAAGSCNLLQGQHLCVVHVRAGRQELGVLQPHSGHQEQNRTGLRPKLLVRRPEVPRPHGAHDRRQGNARPPTATHRLAQRCAASGSLGGRLAPFASPSDGNEWRFNQLCCACRCCTRSTRDTRTRGSWTCCSTTSSTGTTGFTTTASYPQSRSGASGPHRFVRGARCAVQGQPHRSPCLCLCLCHSPPPSLPPPLPLAVCGCVWWSLRGHAWVRLSR